MEGSNLNLQWVWTQLVLHVLCGETSQRICEGIFEGGEVLGLRYDGKIVVEDETLSVRVDGLMKNCLFCSNVWMVVTRWWSLINM